MSVYDYECGTGRILVGIRTLWCDLSFSTESEYPYVRTGNNVFYTFHLDHDEGKVYLMKISVVRNDSNDDGEMIFKYYDLNEYFPYVRNPEFLNLAISRYE